MAADYLEIENALRRMVGEFNDMTTVGTDGGVDNIFKITRAETAAYFYAPPFAELIELAQPRAADGSAGAPLGVDLVVKNLAIWGRSPPPPGIEEGGISQILRGPMETTYC